MRPHTKRLRLSDEDTQAVNARNKITPSSMAVASLAVRSSRLREREGAKSFVQPTSPPTTVKPTSIVLDSTGSALDRPSETIPSPSRWTGWAELENDPIIFNVMLKDWGVEGVNVQEVVPLDAIFDSSAQSTYGLIFLSRYSPSEHGTHDEAVSGKLWFANQTSSFSCATVALMNIINNRTDIDLGSELKQFKASTANLSSKDRGLSLDSFDHVRQVHNSFATEIDMMNVDTRLKQDAAAARRPKPKNSKKKGKSKYVDTYEDENGFHFIAYVPADNWVWRMDGLEPRPQSLGTLSPGDSWLAMVIPDLQAQWETAMDSQLEYSLLSLVHGEKEATSQAEDQDKASRLREDWGPLIAALVRMHAVKGTLEESIG